jgi:hypothetical protein
MDNVQNCDSYINIPPPLTNKSQYSVGLKTETYCFPKGANIIHGVLNKRQDDG